MRKLIIVLVLAMFSLNVYAGGGEGNEGDTTISVNFNGIFPEIFDDATEVAESVDTESHIGAIQGVIERIEGRGFRYVILKDADGKEHKLLWLHNFKGSDLLSQRSKEWAGKTVMVEFQPLKCYMPKEQSFVVIPQMRGLSLQ